MQQKVVHGRSQHAWCQLGWCVLSLCVVLVPGTTHAQLSFESDPINYDTAPTHDPVSKLQVKIDSGQVQLRFDEKHGYLPAVLEHLGVSKTSQMLVFSKTSFQLRRIAPRHPRAVYFGDGAYVGWVQGGDVVEVASVDPQQGAVFYTLTQQPVERPRFVRDRGQCLSCHASARTAGVPGHLVRSVLVADTGHAVLGTRTYATDHRSPFEQRWGGWYVTGTHGKQRHLGNLIVAGRTDPEQIDLHAGANVTDLSDRLSVAPYLTPHSDIVALLVLEHQTQMHNLITRANFETRSALHYDQVMNRALERPEDFRSDITKRRIASVGDRLVEYMLFVDEYRLQAPVKGTSEFAEEFSAAGPRDGQGRSLRQLNLEDRLMEYPCSYLIYSDAFDALPEAAAEHVYRRLWEVLTGRDESETFSHLSAADRRAILEILRATKASLPEYWR